MDAFQVRHRHLVEALLACGILSSILYVAADLIASWSWRAYRYADQTVSELSAIDAPTRSLWHAFGTAYAVLLLAFGLGVWTMAGRRRSLRLAGALFMAMSLLDLTWPPMHLRGTTTSLTDTLHIVWTAANGVLTIAAMIATAVAFGWRFRAYVIATIAALVIAGAWVSRFADRVPADLPTPWMGAVERINVYGYLAWVAVLGVALLRELHARERPARLRPAHAH